MSSSQGHGSMVPGQHQQYPPPLVPPGSSAAPTYPPGVRPPMGFPPPSTFHTAPPPRPPQAITGGIPRYVSPPLNPNIRAQVYPPRPLIPPPFSRPSVQVHRMPSPPISVFPPTQRPQLVRPVTLVTVNARPVAPAAPAASLPAQEKPQTSVYVGKIASTVEDSLLKKILELCGPVKSWKRAVDPTTQTQKGFGFCEFENTEGILRALRILNKYSLDGQELVLNVNQATRQYLDNYVAKKKENATASPQFQPLSSNVTPAGSESASEIKPDQNVKLIQKSSASTSQEAFVGLDKEKSNKAKIESVIIEEDEKGKGEVKGMEEKGAKIEDSTSKEDKGDDKSPKTFGIVSQSDRDADNLVLEKLKEMIEERAKSLPPPPPPKEKEETAANAEKDKTESEVESEKSLEKKHGDLKDTKSEKPEESKMEDIEKKADSKREAEETKEEESASEKNRRRLREIEREKEKVREKMEKLEREKEREKERLQMRLEREKERERERERGRRDVFRERDRDPSMREVERLYEQKEREWSSREREKERARFNDREREKEREKERLKLVWSQEEEESEEESEEARRRRRRDTGDEKKRRKREKEEDEEDRLKEIEEEKERVKRLKMLEKEEEIKIKALNTTARVVDEVMAEVVKEISPLLDKDKSLGSSLSSIGAISVSAAAPLAGTSGSLSLDASRLPFSSDAVNTSCQISVSTLEKREGGEVKNRSLETSLPVPLAVSLLKAFDKDKEIENENDEKPLQGDDSSNPKSEKEEKSDSKQEGQTESKKRKTKLQSSFASKASSKQFTLSNVFAVEEEERAEQKLRPLVPIDYDEDIPNNALGDLSRNSQSPTSASGLGSVKAGSQIRERSPQVSTSRSPRDGPDILAAMEFAKSLSLMAASNAPVGSAVNGVMKEEKEKTKKPITDVKSLIDSIPTSKPELFSLSVDWDVYDAHKLHEKMEPWIARKVKEYLGEEEKSLVEFIVSSIKDHLTGDEILKLLKPVLDEEAELFVLKMWRMLIFEIRRVQLGLR